MSDSESQRNDLAAIPQRNRHVAGTVGIIVGYVIALAAIFPYGVWAMGMGWGGGSPPPEPEVARRPVLDRIGGLKSPARMAMSDMGDIYVTDTKRGIVAVFNRDGERVGTLKGVKSPLGIAVQDVETTINVEVEDCVTIYNQEEKILKLKEKIAKIEQKLNRVRTRKTDYIANLEAELAGYMARLAELESEAGDTKHKKRYKLEKKIRKLKKKIYKIDQKLEHARDRKSKHITNPEAKLARKQERLAELEADTTTECTVTVTPKTVVVTRTYVGDNSDGSVRIFEDGKPVGFLGNGSGEFLKPNGIALTSDGTVFVADSKAHHIAVYDSAGNRLSTFGSQGSGDGKLDFPTDIALNESVGELYVSDFENGRVAVFSLGGGWLRNIDAPLNSSGDPAFFRAAGIGIDPAGNLYVADNALSCLVIMSSTGELLDIIGFDNGRYWTGDLLVPIDSVSDGTAVWVSSSGNGKINVYEVQQ